MHVVTAISHTRPPQLLHASPNARRLNFHAGRNNTGELERRRDVHSTLVPYCIRQGNSDLDRAIVRSRGHRPPVRKATEKPLVFCACDHREARRADSFSASDGLKEMSAFGVFGS